MQWLERLKHRFDNEASEVKESVDDLSARLDADLTRREAELDATPEQKLDGILDEIGENEAVFDELGAQANAQGDDR
jgi:hypothetical protein